MKKIIELMDQIKEGKGTENEIYRLKIRADLAAKDLLQELGISYSNKDNISIKDLFRCDRWCPRAKGLIKLLCIRYTDDETYLWKKADVFPGRLRKRVKDVVITEDNTIYYY